MTSMAEVKLVATYTVELGVDDENLAEQVRTAAARELRRALGPDIHVQVTMKLARPEPEPAFEKPTGPPSPAQAFAQTSAFFRHRQA